MEKSNVEVTELTPEAWRQLSEMAHNICFNERKPWEFDRIDYALLCLKDNVPAGYVTCREVDHETVYWQYGGAFPNIAKGPFVIRFYTTMIGKIKEKGYKRINTFIENTNTAMLKLAMSVGFRIHGIKHYNGTTLLEHILEV